MSLDVFAEEEGVDAKALHLAKEFHDSHQKIQTVKSVIPKHPSEVPSIFDDKKAFRALMNQNLSDPGHSLPMQDAMTWYSFYSLLRYNKGMYLKANILDTILLNKDGLPTSWFGTNRKGFVVEMPVRHVTIDKIRSLFLQRASSNTDKDVCLERNTHGSRILTQPEFEGVLVSLALDTPYLNGEYRDAPPPVSDLEAPKVSGTASSRGEGRLPFCLQTYVQPKSDVRFVTTFMATDHSVVCESFPTRWSRRYRAETGVLSRAEELPPIDGMILLQLKRTTVSIVNFIKKAHGLQLLGLVCEYVCDLHGTLWLTSVLGTRWDGDDIPSWIRFRNTDIDSQLICSLVLKLPLGAQRGPSTKAATEASSISYATAGLLPNTSVLDQEKGDRPATAPTHSSPLAHKRSQFLRNSAEANSRRIEELPEEEQSDVTKKVSFDSPRSKTPKHVHRLCRPPLLIQLSHQVEVYRDSLQQQLMDAATTKMHYLESHQRAEHVTSERDKVAAMLSDTVCKFTQKLEEYKRALQLMEERAMAAETDNQSLRKSLKLATGERDSLKSTVDAERATTFEVINDYQSRVSKHLSQIRSLEELSQKQQAQNGVLIEQREEARKKLLILQGVEEAQNIQLSEMRKQINALEKDKRESKQKIAALQQTIAEHIALRRVPLDKPKVEKARPEVVKQVINVDKIDIRDLVHKSILKDENKAIHAIVSDRAPQIQQVFMFYNGRAKPQGFVNKSAAMNLSLAQFKKFVSDVGFCTSGAVTMANCEDCFLRANATRTGEYGNFGEKSVTLRDSKSVSDRSLLLPEFVEAIIRIGYIKYMDDDKLLSDRFAHIVQEVIDKTPCLQSPHTTAISSPSAALRALSNTVSTPNGASNTSAEETVPWDTTERSPFP